jgi:mono/diheme cytochrome c family protein
MKKVLILFVAVSGLTFAGAAEGKAVYASKCAACHGANGEGKDAVAKMMKVEMKPLSSKEVQSMSDADLKKIILEGKGKMKAQTVSPKQADDVVAFVKTLK